MRQISNRLAVILPAVVVVLGLWAPLVAQAPCYRTPEDAVGFGSGGGKMLGVSSGFRVESRQADVLLRRTVVMVAWCGHPDWPAITLLTPASPEERKPSHIAAISAPSVRAGERLRVVQRGQLAQLDTMGTAETGGSPGDKIRVRLLRISPEMPDQYVSAVVRGTQYAEMEP